MGVDEFPELEAKLGEFMADICVGLGCNEALNGNGADYIGCQSVTDSGRVCQAWYEQFPHSHSFTPAWYQAQHIGNHNFCRNPDGEATIWCYTTDPASRGSCAHPVTRRK